MIDRLVEQLRDVGRRKGGSRPGPRKDTVIVLPNQTVTVNFDADNRG